MKKKIIALALTLLMIFNICSVIAFAEPEPVAEEIYDIHAIPDELDVDLSSGDILKTDDINELNSLTIDHGNGSNTLYLYQVPVKYIDESSGDIKFIRNDMVRSNKKIGLFKKYSYENFANDVKVYYPNDIDDGLLFEYKDFSVAMRPYIESKGNVELITIDGMEHCQYNINDNMVIQYRNINNGTKENIILNERPESNVIKFIVTMDGVIPLFMEGESIPLVVPGTTEPVSILGQVDARDSYEGEYPEGETHFTLYNSLKLTAIDENRYILDVIIDQDFLNSESTVYPVVIDPSVTISRSYIKDTTVYSGAPDKQIYYSNSYLIVGDHGSSYGEGQAYIQLTDISQHKSINPNYITYAYFRTYEGSGKTHWGQIRVCEPTGTWDPTTITWKNKPAAYATLPCKLDADPSYMSTGSGWYNFNITPLFKNWLKAARGEGGKSLKFGFALKSMSQASSKHFCSAENGNYIPSVVVQFANNGYGIANSYLQEDREEINCLGYALRLNYKVAENQIPLTSADTLYTMATKVEEYVQKTLKREIRRLTDANAYINSNEYRFCMRFGKKDGLQDIHFWLQTNTGEWAEKQGEKASRKIGYINPSDAIWNAGFYDSSTIYFAVTWN